MKGSWEHPSVTIQDYEANEYVSSCWGVGCNINVADAYEQTHTNSAGVTWWTLGCNHTVDHCQNADNQVIYDDNNDGIADRMLEEGTGAGTPCLHHLFGCRLYDGHRCLFGQSRGPDLLDHHGQQNENLAPRRNRAGDGAGIPEPVLRNPISADSAVISAKQMQPEKSQIFPAAFVGFSDIFSASAVSRGGGNPNSVRNTAADLSWIRQLSLFRRALHFQLLSGAVTFLLQI